MKLWIYEYLVSYLGEGEVNNGVGAAIVHRDKPIKRTADVQEVERYLEKHDNYGKIAINHYQLIGRRWRW